MGSSSLPIRSLAEIPDLQGLSQVCRDLNVEISAFGSLVRRLARHYLKMPARRTQPRPPSLFDLAPFISDIDIVHSGPSDSTAMVRSAIMAAVPFSEHFRWEVFSKEKLDHVARHEHLLPLIPANKLILRTTLFAGIEDPYSGLLDILDGRFRLERSPYYKRHYSFVYGRTDSEMLYAIRYLSMICEEVHASLPGSDISMPDQPDRYLEALVGQPGVAAVLEIVRECTSSNELQAFEESAAMRARLRYRFESLRGACRSVSAWTWLVGPNGVLRPLINRYAARWPSAMPFTAEANKLAPAVASCRIRGDHYRLGKARAPSSENASMEWMVSEMRDLPADHLSTHAQPELAPGLEILADSPEYQLNVGRAPSAEENEHIHITIPLEGSAAERCEAIGEKSLSGLIKLTARLEESDEPGVMRSWSIVLPVHCVCWLERVADTLLVKARIACDRLLSDVPETLCPLVSRSRVAIRLRAYIVGDCS